MRPPSFTITGRHVLIAMIVFFGAIILMNAVFITLAIRSFPGEDAPHPYQAGLDFNDALERRRAQAALGWSETVDVLRGDDAQIVIVMRDAAAAPLSGLSIDAELRRPADAGEDRTLVFEALGGGRYRAYLDGAAAGQWELRARATDASGRVFEFRSRIWL